MDNARMRRAFIGVSIVAALIVVPSGWAHVTVTPTRVSPGADVVLQFAVPDERSDTSIVDFTVRAPTSLVLEEIESPAGWKGTLAGSSLRWSGGKIEPRQLQTFRVEAFARRAGTITLDARIRYAKGGGAAYHPRVVAGGPPSFHARDTGAHSLAKWALFVALAAAVLALGAWLVALGGWLKRG
jgi:hypothetical protein